MDFTPINHIELINGIPFVAGRRVKVKMIANLHNNGASIEDIMEQYTLNHSEVYAALAYYYDHKDFIDQTLQEGETAARQTATDANSHLAELRSRLKKD